MYISSSKERSEIMATFLIENQSTVRAVAKQFGVSKSTVHKDITHNLRSSDPILYAKVKEVLEKNKQERHLRGGEATKQKFLMKKQNGMEEIERKSEIKIKC